MLPGTNGIQLARLARERHPGHARRPHERLPPERAAAHARGLRGRRVRPQAARPERARAVPPEQAGAGARDTRSTCAGRRPWASVRAPRGCGRRCAAVVPRALARRRLPLRASARAHRAAAAAEDRELARLLHLPRGGRRSRAPRRLAAAGPASRAARSSSSTTRGSSPPGCSAASETPAAGSKCSCSGGSATRELETGPAQTRAAEIWRALGKASKPLRFGADVEIVAAERRRCRRRSGPACRSCVRLLGRADDDGLLEVALWTPSGGPSTTPWPRCGHVPLPPYIKRDDSLEDAERYQTVFARHDGAVAAPTAGLHLTRRPPRAPRRARLRDRERHAARRASARSSRCRWRTSTITRCTPSATSCLAAAADAVARARARGAPVVAVGTTTVRALESAADPDAPGRVRAGEPARRASSSSRATPCASSTGSSRTSTCRSSTLLALVCAFAGTRARARRVPSRGDRALPLLLLRRRDAPLERRLIAADARLRVPRRRRATGRRGARVLDDAARRPSTRPTFMPVGTQGSVKTLTPDEVASTGRAHRPRQHVPPDAAARAPSAIAGLGGLHAFTRWPHAMLTDSGGFQAFSLVEPPPGMRSLVAAAEDGFAFQSHLDGSMHTLTPEDAVRVQGLLGADIQMQLDVCPPGDSPRAGRRGRRRADDALGQARARGAATPAARRSSASCRAPASPTCGAPTPTSSGRCPSTASPSAASRSASPSTRMHETLAEVASALDPERPRYLMGVGTPRDLVVAIGAGVDMFDCVLPTRNARNGQALTRVGPRRHQAGALQGRPAPDRRGVRVRLLRRGLLARLPPAPLPRGRDPVPAAALAPQPALVRRARGRRARGDRRRELRALGERHRRARARRREQLTRQNAASDVARA